MTSKMPPNDPCIFTKSKFPCAFLGMTNIHFLLFSRRFHAAIAVRRFASASFAALSSVTRVVPLLVGRWRCVRGTFLIAPWARGIHLPTLRFAWETCRPSVENPLIDSGEAARWPPEKTCSHETPSGACPASKRFSSATPVTGSVFMFVE